MSARYGLGWALFLGVFASACDRSSSAAPQPNGSATPSVSAPAAEAAPQSSVSAPASGLIVLPPQKGDFAIVEPEVPSCPPDMVRVKKKYCIDRYEASFVDVDSGREISPYYVPSRNQAVSIKKLWDEQRLTVGPPEAHEVELPPLPLWETERNFEPKAVSRKGRVPQGYLTGPLAALACKNAKKRLCTIYEWRSACRGEEDRLYPYGDHYEQGKCNIFREAHPAAMLHGSASVGHSDPRLNTVKAGDKPLLRMTGATPTCMSHWEGDAIADMVGNIDEWIDDPAGTFVGGFYARSKKDGCDSQITGHPFEYFDYSIGVRCCMDLPQKN